MIVVLDNEMGNAGSVINMIKRAGGSAILSSDPEVIKKAEKLILPGVGSFDRGITNLRQSTFFDVLTEKVHKDKTPFLGICLGMQLLFESSEEGELPGLGWIKGNVKRFNFAGLNDASSLKIPHMGWNLVKATKLNKLLPDNEIELRYYFVHSYHVECNDPSDILATSPYGYEFTCAVQRDNIFGAQFHPEKSHRFGLGLLRKFIEL